MRTSRLTLLLLVSLTYAGCEKNKTPTDPGQTLLDPPTLIVEDTSFTGDVLLRWTASKNATGYLLQEDEEVGFSSPMSVYEGAETSATVTRRPFGNVYFYRVQAVQGSSRSNWSIPIAVTIVVMPHILVSVESLEFGYTAVGSQRILSFTIDNAAAVPLQVMLVLSSPNNFSIVDSSSFTVFSGTRRLVAVEFMPIVVGTFTETLSIFSSDTANNPIIIQITGSSEITSAQPDTIILLTDNPRSITTVGGSGPTTAISAFEVRDSLNRPLGLAHQHEVQFILSGSPINGGAFVSPQTVSTNDSGRVFTTINSGTEPGILECIARLTRNSDGLIIESERDTIYVE